MRSRSGLRVVLDGGALDVPQRQPFHGAVVQVDVGELGGAEVRLPAHRLVAVDRPRAVRAEHREAVVLAGDLDRAGRQVLDRVVGAVVAERQLVGLEADRAAQQLMAEADAVDRELADRARGRSRRCSRATPGRRGRWPGRSRRGRSSSSSSRVAVHGMQLDGGAALGEVADDRALDAGVDHGDPGPIRDSRPGRTRPESLGGEPVAGFSTVMRSGVTSRARSRPVIAGSASISARASPLGEPGAGIRHRASRPGRGCGARARACRRP